MITTREGVRAAYRLAMAQHKNHTAAVHAVAQALHLASETVEDCIAEEVSA